MEEFVSRYGVFDLCVAGHPNPKYMMDSDPELLNLSLLAASIEMDWVNFLVSEFWKSDNEDKEDNMDDLGVKIPW